jgi:hypothetical protein
MSRRQTSKKHPAPSEGSFKSALANSGYSEAVADDLEILHSQELRSNKGFRVAISQKKEKIG